MRIRIPVAVSRNGYVATGAAWHSDNGELKTDETIAADSLNEEAFDSGYMIIHVETEIDHVALFREIDVAGTVVVDGGNG